MRKKRLKELQERNEALAKKQNNLVHSEKSEYVENQQKPSSSKKNVQEISENTDAAPTSDPDITSSDHVTDSHHECIDECSDSEDEDTEEIQIHPENTTPDTQTAPQPEPRRSSRVNKGIKCHSCTGCCSVRNYLQKIYWQD